MSDKAKMPRMREQYKDNAIEVSKNAEIKAEVKKHEFQEKAAVIREQEEDQSCSQ